jgi:hypothetical protein
MDEQYSLSNLRDIHVPEPPPWWPPAPELWLLLAILIAALAILFYQWRQFRRRNAYRKVGLSLLADAGTAHEVSVVLKRVALAAYPREQVASLVGDDWTAFLRQTGAKGDVSPLVDAPPDRTASNALKRVAGAWIKGHRVPRAGAEEGGSGAAGT